jgi:hypothetical protein
MATSADSTANDAVTLSGVHMATDQRFERRHIKAALNELDNLSRDEYGIGLERLLLDPSPDSALRLQRIVGIVLKRPFARRAPPVSHSRTGARRSWPWADETPDKHAGDAPKEFAILNELRMPGPWNERKPIAEPDGVTPIPITWAELKDDADNERGLFKILALYVDDTLKNRDRRTLREYLEADESRRFEAGLDLAAVAFDWAVTAPLLTLLGVPSLAIGVALVGIQYGYRRATDTHVERVGDGAS